MDNGVANYLSKKLEPAIVEAKKLTTQKRNDLPASDFGCPEDRSFPIHDRSHAINALARLNQPHQSKCSDEAIRARIYARYPDLKPKS